MTNRKHVYPLQAAGFLVGIFLVVSIPLALLSHLNSSRSERIYQAYAQELTPWVEKNRSGLDIIFTELFPGACEANVKQSPCPSLEKSELMTLISSDLDDFSSTAFIRLYKDGQPRIMRLSGEVEDFYLHGNNEPYREVISMLQGEREVIPWQEYFYSIPGKEVIVMYKDSEGKILGGIIRGVIEEK